MSPKLKIILILEAYILLLAKYHVQKPKTKWKYGWGSCAQKGDQMKEVHYWKDSRLPPKEREQSL